MKTAAPFHASRFTPHVSRFALHASRLTPHVSRFTSRSEKILLTLILLIFGLLAAAYSITIPLFETPDEDHHFFYIKRLADGHGLAIVDPAHPGPWGQEAGQPPLYYALGALLIRAIDTVRLSAHDEAQRPADALAPNPHANLGNPLQPGNKNRWVHTPAENWPWRGWVLAAHLLRFFSILLGLGAVYLTYRLAEYIFLEPTGGAGKQTKGRKDEKTKEAGMLALVAAALTAFLPQVIFSSASINNDNLVIFLATLALLLLARIGASDQRPTWPSTLLLGFVAGLAALAKVSGLLLLPLTAVVLLWRGWRTRRWGQALAHLTVVALLALAIAGWWYARNWQLYGDPTGLRPMIAIVGPRTQPLTWQTLPVEFQGLRISLFGLFGWFNLPLPNWVYRLWDAFLLLASAGLLLALWRRRPHTPSLPLLALWLLLALLSLLRLTSLTLGSQGRLLLPAIAAITILLIRGWSQWLPPQRRPGQIWLALPPAASLLTAFLSLILVIAPAYRRPPLLALAALPASARIDPLTITDRIQLLGIAIDPTTLHPGQPFDLTLYWQALQPIPFDASIALRLFGPGDQPYAQWDTYPGWGNFATTLWPTGVAIADHYRQQAPWDAPAPTLLKLDLSLYDYASKTSYPSRLPSGAPPPLGLATLRLLPAEPPTPLIPHPAAFDFDGRIRLLGYGLPAAPSSHFGQVFHPGDTVDLDLFWQATKPVGEDFQVFVHLLDDNDQRQAGYDAAPRGGWWPTSAWEPGQIVQDRYPLPLPLDLKPGRYTLAAGLYRLDTLERLPVSSPPDSTRDRAALLTTIEVAP